MELLLWCCDHHTVTVVAVVIHLHTPRRMDTGTATPSEREIRVVFCVCSMMSSSSAAKVRLFNLFGSLANQYFMFPVVCWMVVVVVDVIPPSGPFFFQISYPPLWLIVGDER